MYGKSDANSSEACRFYGEAGPERRPPFATTVTNSRAPKQLVGPNKSKTKHMVNEQLLF